MCYLQGFMFNAGTDSQWFRSWEFSEGFPDFCVRMSGTKMPKFETCALDLKSWSYECALDA